MRVNLAYVISQVSNSALFEWTALLLSKKKYRLVFILMHGKDSPFEQFLRREGFSVYRVPFKSKYDIPLTIVRIRNIFKREKISIVHTHLFEGGLAGISAAKLAGIPKRIHTRHDATIHHDYHPQAVKYDKAINGLATQIIAITQNVKRILVNMEQVPAAKVRVIHHGFLQEEFQKKNEERIKALSATYFPNGKPYPVIGVISRFIEWKGIQYIIPAFAEVRKKYPQAHLVLANAQGPYENELGRLLDALPADSYTKIVFEKDIGALYKQFDVFVHTPVDEKAEAFGQVYIEAMAAGIPSVVTLSGIAPDFIEDKIHALVVPFRETAAIAERVSMLLEDPALKNSIVKNARMAIAEEFSVERMIRELESCYDA